MILVVDNYDSFTYNLVQMLGAQGAEVAVVRNDVRTALEIVASRPRGIVLSPGPGRPEAAGVCVELLRLRAPLPLLGVCLGHQALAVAFGAAVDRAPRPGTRARLAGRDHRTTRGRTWRPLEFSLTRRIAGAQRSTAARVVPAARARVARAGALHHASALAAGRTEVEADEAYWTLQPVRSTAVPPRLKSST